MDGVSWVNGRIALFYLESYLFYRLIAFGWKAVASVPPEYACTWGYS